MYASTVAASIGLMAPLLVANAATAAPAMSGAPLAAHQAVAPAAPAGSDFTLAWATSRASVPTLARNAAPAAVPAAAPAAPPAAAPAPNPDSCAAAIAYLHAHANPEFRVECPGYAAGHQAMTCMNRPGLCPGEDLIAIAVPCPASYENEARNSYILTGQSGNVGHADDQHPQGCP